MVSEVQKYRANMFQISGFALMTPFGRLTLNFLDFELIDINIKFVFYIIFTAALLLGGIILLSKGIDVLEGKG